MGVAVTTVAHIVLELALAMSKLCLILQCVSSGHLSHVSNACPPQEERGYDTAMIDVWR